MNKNYFNWMLRLVKGLKTDSKAVNGERCMKVSDGKLCFSKDRGNIWKDYMERIMNEENNWDHNGEGDAVVFISRGGASGIRGLEYNKIKTEYDKY